MLKLTLIALLIAALTIIPASAAGPERPWASNEYGALTVVPSWNLTLGYVFRPLVDGYVTRLGGYYGGKRYIFLWESPGAPVRQVQVTSDNSWVFADIEPYPVVAGQSYTVAVYLQGSQGTYRHPVSLPATYGNIEIVHAAGTAGYGYPAGIVTNYMMGQVDIEFVAGTLETPTATPSPTVTPMPTATPVPTATPPAYLCPDGVTAQLPHPSLPTLWYCPVDGVVYYHD